MTKLINFKKALWKDESGATAIEYGLLAALIAVVIIGAVATLGSTLNDTFTTVNDEIENPTGLAGSIGAGYNFRAGKTTTLGAAVRLVYAPLSVDEGSGTQVETLIPALLVTGSVF